MTRNDYQLIADCIRTPYLDAAPYSSERSHMDQIIQNFVRELGRDNPRFDAARFVAACTT